MELFAAAGIVFRQFLNISPFWLIYGVGFLFVLGTIVFRKRNLKEHARNQKQVPDEYFYPQPPGYVPSAPQDLRLQEIMVMMKVNAFRKSQNLVELQPDVFLCGQAKEQLADLMHHGGKEQMIFKYDFYDIEHAGGENPAAIFRMRKADVDDTINSIVNGSDAEKLRNNAFTHAGVASRIKNGKEWTVLIFASFLNHK